MARAKDAPTQVGGQIDPYVQTTMQRGRQQAENRLVAAMQEKGAAERTAVTERGAGERAELQAETQRAGMAAQAESDDKRAAENERARREDRKFAQTMQESTRDFQAKQAELDREQQRAIIAGDRKYKDEIEKRREAFRRFNIELNMDDKARRDNAALSILKGSLKRETSMEKAKTVLEEEATRFDKDKDVYSKTRERVTEAVAGDKRMDLPIGKSAWEHYKEKTKAKGVLVSPLEPLRTMYEAGKAVRKDEADPMGVLQDQIGKYGGGISVEELAPENINKIEDQIQKGDIKTEDINKTLGAIEGMIEAVKGRRDSFDKESDEFDFWQDTNLNMAQMRDALEGLANSTDKKIAGSETESVGSRVQYALGTVQDSSLGGRAARMRDLVGGNFESVFEEMTKSVQVPKQYPLSADMNKYDIEYRTWFNNYLQSRYPELEVEGVE